MYPYSMVYHVRCGTHTYYSVHSSMVTTEEKAGRRIGIHFAQNAQSKAAGMGRVSVSMGRTRRANDWCDLRRSAFPPLNDSWKGYWLDCSGRNEALFGGTQRRAGNCKRR
jgi:hypothetical protein